MPATDSPPTAAGTVAGTVADTRSLNERVLDEQARLVFERLRVSTWAGLPAAALIVWLLTPLQSPAVLGSWLVFKLLVIGCRFWVDQRVRSEGSYRQWSRPFAVLLAIDGLLYGMLSWALLPDPLPAQAPNLPAAMFTAVIAIAAVGAVVLAVSWRACVAFVLPLLVPSILALADGDRISLFLAVGGAIFLALIVIEVRKSDQHTRAMLRLRFEMDGLAAERQAALERALRSDAAKAQFLATMSHEMRTPLHGILGLAQELNRGGAAPVTQAAHLQTIMRTGDHLLSIINDVLDHSKIESGHLRLGSAPFELNTLLVNAAALHHLAAEERGLTLVLQASLPADCWLLGDAPRLRQVLMNLLGNAVKFTEQGGVTLRANSEPSAVAGAAPTITIEIADTGPGVPQAERERIFDPFHQIDGSWSRRKGGTGLGLAISRELVQAMGGQLSCIEPPPAELDDRGGPGGRVGSGGAVFRLTLALPPSEPHHRDGNTVPQHAAPSATARRVLLAEDNEVNAIVARAMLERAGLVVSHARDGLEAVTMAATEGHDVILMDCQMPGIDGFEATRRIRDAEHKAARKPVPIIALTANALDGDRDRCLAAGMDDHLGKPFDEATLLALVAHHASQAALIRSG